MPTLNALSTVTQTTSAPGDFVRVTASKPGDAMRVTWSGPGGNSGQLDVRNTSSAGQDVGPFVDGTEIMFLALSGTPSYDGAFVGQIPALVSGGGKGRTVAFFGDSITDSAGQVTLFGYRLNSFVNGFGSANYSLLSAEPETPSGVGNWVYDSGTKTATWAAFGESAGEPVDVSRSGIFYFPSSVAGHGITAVMDGSLTSYTSGTTTITVAANGNQYQALYAPRGYAPCALMQAGTSWDFAHTSVYRTGIALGGVPGFGSNTLAAAVWQTDQIAGADAEVIEIGTNDVAGGRSASAIIADMTTFIESRRLKAARVGVMTIPPRSSPSAFTATQLKVRAQVNSWIKDYCASKPGLNCLDIAAAVTDPATGVWVTGYSTDGVHPSNTGAWAMARVVSSWLLSINADTPFRPSFDSNYEATNNPYGACATVAGMLTFEGSGGTAGAGGSGVVPANYSLLRQSGTIVAVGSKVARTDNVAGSWYQLAITGGGAGEYMRITRQTDSVALATLGLAVGDEIEGFTEVNIPASVGLKYCDMLLTFSGVSGRSVQAFSDAVVGGNAILQDSMGKFWLRLPRTTIPVGATAISISWRFGADTSATVQLGGYWVGKARPIA